MSSQKMVLSQIERLSKTESDQLFLLRELLKSLKQVCVAYSGGVDSSLVDAIAYEQLKELTRGRDIDREVLHQFIHSSALPEKEKNRLLEMKPEDYLGMAAKLAQDV